MGVSVRVCVHTPVSMHVCVRIRVLMSSHEAVRAEPCRKGGVEAGGGTGTCREPGPGDSGSSVPPGRGGEPSW